MNDPTKSYCSDFGHGKLIYIGESPDGLESEYMCIECKEILSTTEKEFNLEEINIKAADDKDE